MASHDLTAAKPDVGAPSLSVTTSKPEVKKPKPEENSSHDAETDQNHNAGKV